ncbi:MAG: hypothetical protein CVU60_01280 [Deltaproteobacteria bacterium HGW-Deltaproteobacteria-18]|jgi:hypothetical protein|nr:MAG: hypothetical protein CVU60_01280 [Deltaproteobacteria bacterium HGW-Deltaproteobacteria-18]
MIQAGLLICGVKIIGAELIFHADASAVLGHLHFYDIVTEYISMRPAHLKNIFKNRTWEPILDYGRAQLSLRRRSVSSNADLHLPGQDTK